MSDKKLADKIVEYQNLLDQDPLELAKDEKAVNRLVELLREQRENVRAMEAAGKQIGSKNKHEKQELNKHVTEELDNDVVAS